MRRVAFYTLGCRLNFAESSDLMRRLQEAGCEIVPFEAAADWYVVNTCTVTAAAEKKCRQIVHQAHRLAPTAKIALVGCFSALRPEQAAALEGVDVVLGTHDKHLLFDYIAAEGKACAPSEEGTGKDTPFVASYSSLGRTRSFFKVQDGCDNFCSYCAIPYARGRSRSASLARTLQTAQEIAAHGVQEIVLTGVNIGDFGRKNGESFLDLLTALESLPVARIRIGSVEPDLLGDEIIEKVANSKKLMPHFHLPLQAGQDGVLAAMKRHYTTDFYARRVQQIRRFLPQAFIACDVIAGFPTETDAQFEEALRFIEGLDLSALHVFSYSPRQEAASFALSYAYDPKCKAARSAALHMLSDKKKQTFYARFADTDAEVLWESDTQNGKMFGYTPNYLKVCAPYKADQVNAITTVRLKNLEKDANKDWCFNG